MHVYFGVTVWSLSSFGNSSAARFTREPRCVSFNGSPRSPLLGALGVAIMSRAFVYRERSALNPGTWLALQVVLPFGRESGKDNSRTWAEQAAGADRFVFDRPLISSDMIAGALCHTGVGPAPLATLALPKTTGAAAVAPGGSF